ncbi:efflux RND transporter periplasmic adaptor subunit [Gammaproteobacteria bacterium]|nr:efflux RND transporter periplasmic adaptor subunit [Gammaproteobacteria bacterium]
MFKLKKNKSILIVFLILISIIYFIFSIWSNYSNKNLTIYGNVDIRNVNLGFRVSGRLLKLDLNEGDFVHKGDLIATIDPEPYQENVKSLKAVVNQQKALFDYAETVYLMEKKLHGTGASSEDLYQYALSSRNSAKASLEKAIADLSKANLNLKDTNLYAFSDGVVLTRVVEPGTMLRAGDIVVSETILDPVWLRAYVTETNLGLAKPGTKVKVFSDSFPDEVFSGSIGFVSSAAEFTPKTVETPDLRVDLVYRIRVNVEDPHHKLLQGMPVTIIFDN